VAGPENQQRIFFRHLDGQVIHKDAEDIFPRSFFIIEGNDFIEGITAAQQVFHGFGVSDGVAELAVVGQVLVGINADDDGVTFVVELDNARLAAGLVFGDYLQAPGLFGPRRACRQQKTQNYPDQEKPLVHFLASWFVRLETAKA